MSKNEYILAFDTANESIAVGLGELCKEEISLVENFVCEAHRESNTRLLPEVKRICEKHNVKPENFSCLAVGCGPGSFTGVRIALATAKGIATAQGIPLIAINTLDAVAWNAWDAGLRGHIYVVADAMRHEIYPALFKLDENGAKRLSSNSVLKAQKAADEAFELCGKCENFIVLGDALFKYFDLFEGLNIANQDLWNPSGQSLLLAAKDKINNKQEPGYVLPVYTRLSDAEESEREKLAKNDEKNLITGVQNNDKSDIKFMPMQKSDIPEIVSLEQQQMKSDGWNSNKLEAELSLTNRTWWVAKNAEHVIAYAGAMHTDNKMELLKICVDYKYQRRGIATQILSYLANDMRNLGAKTCILEVRANNKNAIAFYQKHKLEKIHERKKYYSDGEDALIMEGPLPIAEKDIAGMSIDSNANSEKSSTHLDKPIIFSVESSCDETACAITANGKVIADCVASQIDFHSRFGGVVPEIASRKHIEAICGVADTCIEKANIQWSDIDAISSTYAPGLVGALVVGMAFAKGLAFSLGVPFIGVNHLEGHMYANKLSETNIELPAIASLISGGNTMLVHVKDWGNYETLGSTIDDAVGEAFDKVAKFLGLGYPGGPVISKLAKNGNPKAIDFPRAMLKSGDYKFSLSGLKTAVINYIDKNKNTEDFNLEDLCASFEQAIIDVQVSKAKQAIQATSAKTFMFGGGVAANPEIREAYSKMCKEENVNLVMAPLSACGDNAAMIGLVANDRYSAKKFFSLDADVSANCNLDIKY